MAIKDLQPRMGKVDIIVEVVDKGEIREFEKFGKPGKVCNATCKDDTGQINLTLWNEQIDQVNVGDKVQISNGYVNEYQGEMQLTTGKFGKLEVVAGPGGSAPGVPESETKDEETEEEAKDELKTDKGEKILTEDEKTEADVLEGDKKDSAVVEEDVQVEEEKIE